MASGLSKCVTPANAGVSCRKARGRPRDEGGERRPRFPVTRHFVKARDYGYGVGMHIHPLISDSATLANLCTRLAEADFVCVDTEIMRESTFFPELCLIQIADSEEAAAIDPMAPGMYLASLLELLVAKGGGGGGGRAGGRGRGGGGGRAGET